MEFDVVGLGVATIDLLLVVDELPGGEQVQKAHATAIAGGGPVATALVALARLGAKTAILDRLGDDIFGRMILEEFRAEGVDTAGVVVEQGATSSKAAILVRKDDGARAITYSPGDCGELHPENVSGEMIRAAKILHLNGRHWQASLHAARIAKEAGVLVSFDGGSHRYRPEHRELMPLVDICIVAGQYAASFADITDAASCAGASETAAAAEALLEAGPKVVAITRGTAGSLIYSREGEPFNQPAYRAVPLVDTTGAGDAYHGAFLFGLARGLSLRQSAQYASAVGALSTRGLGGRSALPTLAEVEAFLQSSLSLA